MVPTENFKITKQPEYLKPDMTVHLISAGSIFLMSYFLKGGCLPGYIQTPGVIYY